VAKVEKRAGHKQLKSEGDP